MGNDPPKITRCSSRRRPEGGLSPLRLGRGRIGGIGRIGVFIGVGCGGVVGRVSFGAALALLLTFALFRQFFLPLLETIVPLGQGHLGVGVGGRCDDGEGQKQDKWSALPPLKRAHGLCGARRALKLTAIGGWAFYPVPPERTGSFAGFPSSSVRSNQYG